MAAIVKFRLPAYTYIHGVGSREIVVHETLSEINDVHMDQINDMPSVIFFCEYISTMGLRYNSMKTG